MFEHNPIEHIWWIHGLYCGQVDDVLQQIFEKFNLDDGESISQEDFEKCMMEVLGSLMLQLEGKPISIKSSKIVDE